MNWNFLRVWRFILSVLVANLESLLFGADSYDRSYDDYPFAVEEVSIDQDWLFFEIEKLLDRCIRWYGRGKKVIEYLVK